MKHVEFVASFLTASGPCYNRGDRALVPDDLAESAIRQRAAIEVFSDKEAKESAHKQIKRAPQSK
jgi:hypothetical protein